MAEKVKWTDEQLYAIEHTNTSMLVSAGAGSGKTSVMIERVVRLIKSGVPIKDFLIISFTKASASDMKNKLIKALSSLEPNAYILEQIDDIMTADVSNLHSFCARLLKTYFYEVGLDPTFVVLDDIEVESAREKALDRLIKKHSDKMDKTFYELVDIFSKNRKIKGLREAILKIYDFLCSIVDRNEWKEKTLESLYNEDLSQNLASKVLLSHMIAEKTRCEEMCVDMIEEAVMSGEEKLASYLQTLDSRIKLINPADSFINNAKRIAKLDRMPNFPKAPEGREFLYEDAKEVKDNILERYKKLREYAVCDYIDRTQESLEITKERIKNLFAVVDEFEEEFSNIKKEKGGLDFNDLEQYALKVLSNSTLLDEIKQKYKYVLVDEYQDINGVQEQILKLLSKDNNRFMVGDVKQSIYRFRLCDPEIFLQKYNLYSSKENSGELVLLNANFRSKDNILQFVNSVFDRTMTQDFGGVDYSKEARLVAGDEKRQKDSKSRVCLLFANCKKNDKLDGEVDVYSVKDDENTAINMEKEAQAEGIMIASEIADLVANKTIVDKDTKKERKIRYSDITILAQSRNAYLAKIVKTIADWGIPISTDIEEDCLEDEYVYGIRSFLEVLSNYKVDYSLFNCMYSRVFGFSADELAKIKLAGEGDFFFERVESALNTQKLDEKLAKKLENFFELLNIEKSKAGYMSARDIAEDVIMRQNIITKVSFEKDSEKRKQKLDKFLASLKNFGVEEYLSENNLAVKCEASQSYGSVRVMTIHKSKGLEFGVVFVAQANKTFNLKSVKGDLLISKDLGLGLNFFDRNARFKFPTIAKQAVKLVETRKLLEEQQRLLYTALTRATDYLYVAGSGNYSAIKKEFPVSPTCFIDFMGAQFAMDERYKTLDYDVKVVENAEELFAFDTQDYKRPIIIAEDDKNCVKEIKEVLSFNYPYMASTKVPLKTAVTTLAEEQREEENLPVLFDEEKASSSAEKGTLMHKFMEKLDLAPISKKEIEKILNDLIEKGVFSKEEAKQIDVFGIFKLLNNPEFAKKVQNAKKILKEREFYIALDSKKYFKTEASDSIVVQGIVDLCLVMEDGLVIIDYKSGNLSRESMAKYKQQIDLYAEAMSKSYNQKIASKYVASLKSGELLEV